jgi:hypothetical protein
VLAILFGIFTILVSIGLAATSLLGGLGVLSFDAEAGVIVLALSCVPILFALYGLFWVILTFGGICIAVFGAMILAALGLEGY